MDMDRIESNPTAMNHQKRTPMKTSPVQNFLAATLVSALETGAVVSRCELLLSVVPVPTLRRIYNEPLR